MSEPPAGRTELLALCRRLDPDASGDLAEALAAWPKLPAAVRAGILGNLLATVRAIVPPAGPGPD